MSGAQKAWHRARRFIEEELWTAELRPRSLPATAVSLLQLVVMIGERFVRNELLLRASALTYVVALSIIPLAAVALSVVEALGVSENLAGFFVDMLLAGAAEAKQNVLTVVQGAQIGSLGTVGGSILVVTTVLTLRHVEVTMNQIWGVSRSRTWLRKFTDYLAVVIVAPLSTGVALSLATTLQTEPAVLYLLENATFAFLYEVGLQQAPTFFFALGFSFLYWFMPNTRVRPLSAVLGGVVSAVLFASAHGLYVDLVVGAARYDALFGSFAQIPLLLLWIYIACAIVLLGSEVSFAHQNLAHYRREARVSDPGAAQREAMALRVAVDVAHTFREGGDPCTVTELADRLASSQRAVRELVDRLVEARILAVRTLDSGDDAYQLGRPADVVPVADVLRAVRGPAADELGEGAPAEVVSELLRELADAVGRVTEKQTLADLVAGLATARAGAPKSEGRPLPRE